mmetsp:Transcript_32235/g.63507  ORF Transcript_32235/g.63507 Transcript_32235/m.63507 type:complete len:179 (-) Transcript_32235:189-725(-)
MVPSGAHPYEVTVPPVFDQPGGGKEPVRVREQVVNLQEIEIHFPVSFNESSDVCAICLFEIGASDPCRRTTCKHAFHADCIIKWWTKEKGKPLNCPVCREIQKVSAHKAKQVRVDAQQNENPSRMFSWRQSQSQPPWQRQEELQATWASYFASVLHVLRRPWERMYREGSAPETPVGR